MALWNYCAVCGKRIESGEPCIGVKEKSDHLCGDSICLNCAKIENLPDGKELVSITDLLARAEAAKARAEKAEREMDAAVERIKEDHWCENCKFQPTYSLCKNDGNCEDCESPCFCEGCKDGSLWEWSGKEE